MNREAICLTVRGDCLTVRSDCLTVRGDCLTVRSDCLTVRGNCLTVMGSNCLTISTFYIFIRKIYLKCLHTITLDLTTSKKLSNQSWFNIHYPEAWAFWQGWPSYLKNPFCFEA